jgi:hypothetical protein
MMGERSRGGPCPREVTAVSEAPVRNREQERNFTLNTDGKRHPWLNLATAYTCIAGLISLLIGLMCRQAHLSGLVLGVTGFVVGMAAQMLSATRVERMFIVFGIVASFVGMGLGFAHGGFS